MPYTLEWAIPDRVVISQTLGEFTGEDITAYNDALNAFVVQSEAAIVHVIMDTTRVSKFPTTIPAVRDALNGSKVAYHGWTIVITQNALVRFLVAFGMKLTNGRFRTVPTIQDAYRFLQEDETLDLSGLLTPEA